MAPIVLYDLHPSPNSKKVRLALGYKGIAHETIAVNPMDRSSIVEVSGQPLTPVLKHGDTVIFDSAAILRYLEANVKREPRLYSSDYDTMKAIERWEAHGGREFGPHVGTMFGQFFTGSPDAAILAKASEEFNEVARKLDKSLNSDGYLVGSAPTAGDFVCAAYVGLSVLSPEQQSTHPIMAFFAENLRLDAECQRLRTWYRSIDKYDV